MSEKQNELVNSKIDSNNLDFVKFRDLKKEDIVKMQTVKMEISLKLSKKTRDVFYQAKIIFSDRLEISVRITKTQWYLIVESLGIEDKVTSHLIEVYVRIVKGKLNDKDSWGRYEVFVANKVSFRDFFAEDDWLLFRKEIKRGAITLDVIDSKTELTDEELKNVRESAFDEE